MILVMGLLAAADVALIAWAATRLSGPPGLANASHVALTLAALAICLLAARRKELRFDPSDMVIGSAFGPCGIVAVALVKSLRWRLPRRRKLTYASRRPDRAPARAHGSPPAAEFDVVYRALEDRITYPEPDQVDSLAVTLRFGEQAARQKALQAVVRSFEPRLSPLIALALSDKDQAIRALAAAASAQISHDVAQAFAEMEGKIANGVSVQELLPLVLTIAGHGCDDVLLPRTQQLSLCRASARYLAAHMSEAVSRDMRKDMRAALARVEQVLAEAEGHQPAAGAAARLVGATG